MLVRGAAVLSGGGEVRLWSQGKWRRILSGLWRSGLATSDEMVLVRVRLSAAYNEGSFFGDRASLDVGAVVVG